MRKFGDPPVSSKVQIKKFEFVGHVMRMETSNKTYYNDDSTKIKIASYVR